MPFCHRPLNRLRALRLLPALAVVLGATVLPAHAASTAASSASNSASSAVGSLADSIGRSSTSSLPGNDLADGDYRVIDITEATDRPDRPGLLRLTLQGEVTTFELFLPRPAFEQARLATGQQVRTRQRPYGIEFARADAPAPFFLALRDEWHRELASHPVTL